MDAMTQEFNRRLKADDQDEDTKVAAILMAIRRGELPVGAILTLDAKLNPNSALPNKFSGQWEVTKIRKTVRGEPQNIFDLHKIGRKGQRLSGWVMRQSVTEATLRKMLITASPPTASTARIPKIVETPANAPMAMRFSMAGPCIPVGRVVRETEQCYFITDKHSKNPNEARRFSKHGLHLVACQRCQHHAQTHYPNGYMD